jgi:hypothetical protein
MNNLKQLEKDIKLDLDENNKEEEDKVQGLRTNIVKNQKKIKDKKKKKSFLLKNFEVKNKKKNNEKGNKKEEEKKKKNSNLKKEITQLIANFNNLDINKDYALELKNFKSDSLTKTDLNKTFQNFRKNLRNECNLQKKNANYYKYLKGIMNDVFKNTLKYVVNENCDKERVMANCFITFNDFFDCLTQDEVKLNEEMEVKDEFFIQAKEIFVDSEFISKKE